MEVDLTGSGLCTPNPSLIVTTRLGDAAGAGHMRLHLRRTGIGRPQPVCLWNPAAAGCSTALIGCWPPPGLPSPGSRQHAAPNRCPVHLSDLAAGADIQVAVPWRARANGGAFSPDGRYLTVVFGGGDTGQGWVIDVAARRLLGVPGAVMVVVRSGW